jgi:hypothetical protein
MPTSRQIPSPVRLHEAGRWGDATIEATARLRGLQPQDLLITALVNREVKPHAGRSLSTDELLHPSLACAA